MTMLQRATRGAALTTMIAVAAMVTTVTGCSNAGTLGNILGGVLGGSGNQVTGTVYTVDTRSQIIAIQQANGQTVNLQYDAKTQVTYQNQTYAVTSLERGDQVTARVIDNGNGAYYTDLVQVDQSVSGTTGTGGGTVQSFQGTVRAVDTTNGMFTLDDASSGVRLTVSMPYNPSRSDLLRFQSLRSGDSVRLYGVLLNNTRVELRQFY